MNCADTAVTLRWEVPSTDPPFAARTQSLRIRIVGLWAYAPPPCLSCVGLFSKPLAN